MRYLFLLLVAVAALLLPSPGVASWGSSCYASPVGGTTFHDYTWRHCSDGDPKWLLLFDYDREVGAWDLSAHYYRELRVDGCFGERSDCPVCNPETHEPERKTLLPGDLLPTGVLLEKVAFRGEHYSHSGKEVNKGEAFQALKVAGGEDKQVPDDSMKPSLTLIGTPEQCAPVLAELEKPENVALRSAVLLQSYAPDALMIFGMGYLPGAPRVCLQAPDGKVLYSEASYIPDRLAAAVRKADPLYDPKKDPNGASADDPLAGVVDWLSQLPLWIYFVVAFIVFLWWKNRHSPTHGASK